MSTAQAPAEARAAAARLALQIGTGFVLSGALSVALELRVPDKLAAGPQTAEALAQASGVKVDPLYRMLRALASVGIFAETSPRTFALTPAADLLRSDVPGSLFGIARWMTDPTVRRIHTEGLYSVQTGQPAAPHVLGVPAFEYLAAHPELSERFNEGMTSMSAAIIPAVLEAYDFSGIGTLVDIAGGHGEILMSILGKYPRMKGVLFDLDHVIAGARPRIEARGLEGRCTAVSGDFFKAVPEGGDAYIMQHIVHDWDDDRAVPLLQNVRKVLRPDGRVLLLEAVIRPGNEPDFAKLLDIEMLLMPGGRERTAEEFMALFTRAGFTLTKIVPTRSPVSVIEARAA